MSAFRRGLGNGSLVSTRGSPLRFRLFAGAIASGLCVFAVSTTDSAFDVVASSVAQGKPITLHSGAGVALSEAAEGGSDDQAKKADANGTEHASENSELIHYVSNEQSEQPDDHDHVDEEEDDNDNESDGHDSDEYLDDDVDDDDDDKDDDDDADDDVDDDEDDKDDGYDSHEHPLDEYDDVDEGNDDDEDDERHEGEEGDEDEDEDEFHQNDEYGILRNDEHDEQDHRRDDGENLLEAEQDYGQLKKHDKHAWHGSVKHMQGQLEQTESGEEPRNSYEDYEFLSKDAIRHGRTYESYFLSGIPDISTMTFEPENGKLDEVAGTGNIEAMIRTASDPNADEKWVNLNQARVLMLQLGVPEHYAYVIDRNQDKKISYSELMTLVADKFDEHEDGTLRALDAHDADDSGSLEEHEAEDVINFGQIVPRTRNWRQFDTNNDNALSFEEITEMVKTDRQAEMPEDGELEQDYSEDGIYRDQGVKLRMP